MRVFVLCTGRCGSLAFAKACSHIENFTSGHETNVRRLGSERLSFPDNHIEIDNRLSYFLGDLDIEYGDEPYFVHLQRNPEKVAESFNHRWDGHVSILKAFTSGLKMLDIKSLSDDEKQIVCKDLVNTTNSSIKLFLKDKTKTQEIHIEKIKTDFVIFWKGINAKGNLEKALKEFEVAHNKTIIANKKSASFFKGFALKKKNKSKQ